MLVASDPVVVGGVDCQTECIKWQRRQFCLDCNTLAAPPQIYGVP